MDSSQYKLISDRADEIFKHKHEEFYDNFICKALLSNPFAMTVYDGCLIVAASLINKEEKKNLA